VTGAEEAGVEDSGVAEAGDQALRNGAAARRVERDVLAVYGPDAGSYLQGQCSQDLAALEAGGSAESLLLSPRGTIDAYLRVTRRGTEEFVLDTDSGYGPVVTARLERFRLRTRVTVEALDWLGVSVRGPEAARALRSGPEMVVAVSWPGWSGVDLLGPAPSGGPSDWVGDPVVWCGEGAWEAARIVAGVPANGREVTDASIAAELGLVERTVSFTKGCFTGQELVARLDARGSRVARRLCGVVFDPEDGLPAVGAVVLSADRANEVGALSSVAVSPRTGGAVALATLHRRVAPPERVEVRWSAGDGDRTVTAEARPLPLDV